VGVLGASGYAGRELTRFILGHPGLELAFATANDQRGQSVRFGRQSVTFSAPDDAPLGDAALVFCALPHGHSKEWARRARDAGAKVVDLSSDLRPGNPGCEPDAVYGLTELARGQVATASLVANPGCYATSVLLPLLPLVQAGYVLPGATVSVAAASGVSGAGNSPKRELLFAEVADDYRAYALGNTHRHLLEMRSLVRGVGGDLDLIFTPHLLPVPRGILSTIHVPLSPEGAAVLGANPNAAWDAAFAGEPFIEVASESPALRDVNFRNSCRMHGVMAQETRVPTLLAFSAIDNLVKGAAGQALQNANLMLGLDETAGLPL
jgi:N-acetyl-gamma-glutamyl-phosphate reductase